MDLSLWAPERSLAVVWSLLVVQVELMSEKKLRLLWEHWLYDIWQQGMPRLCVLGFHGGVPGGNCPRCGLGPR